MLSRSSCRHLVAATAVALVACSPIPQASAQPQPPQLQPRQEMRERDGMLARGSRDSERSLSDAVRRVQRTTGGHILGAERVPYDGRDINRVKYMDDRGRVRYMDDPVQQRSQPRSPRSDMSSLRGDNP